MNYMFRGKLKRKRVINEIGTVEELVRLIDKYGLKCLKIGVNGDFHSLEEAKIQGEYTSLENCIIFQVKQTKLEITTEYLEGRPTTYIFDLNLEADNSALTGHQAFAQFNRYFKVPDAKTYKIPEFDAWMNPETGKYVCSASPILDYNKKYNNKETKDVYEYDLNSAYAAVLLNKVPDLSAPVGRDRTVAKGEIGFLLDDHLTLVYPGYEADVIFKEIDAPQSLKDYINKHYRVKQCTTGRQKTEAKQMLNFPVGYCQRKNPFLRAYVIHKCNAKIRQLIDENTLCWNTDAVFTTKPLDVPLGTEIGQFKVVKFETFRMRGNTYQAGDEMPVWRGVPKAYFKRFEHNNHRPFNLLTDELDDCVCLYSFDFKTMKLVNNYEE